NAPLGVIDKQMNRVSHQHYARNTFCGSEFVADAPRFGRHDRDNRALEPRFETCRRVAEKQAPLMKQRYSMASLGLVEVRGGIDDGDALADEGIEHRPEFAARN